MNMSSPTCVPVVFEILIYPRRRVNKCVSLSGHGYNVSV